MVPTPRVGAVGDAADPKLPAIICGQIKEAVELDLSAEKAAMRTHWIAVGLFFSPQAFGTEGLFREMKSKWGLRGRLTYSPLKNNRYLMEFEREGDRRHILNNGPWTHKGDAFLMVVVDGSQRPADVEVAHMPIWVRVHDTPPIMMSERVAWKVGAELGEVLAVDCDKEGKIWGDYIRIRIKHDVDVPLRSDVTFHEKSENDFYCLEVKYERVPRFCGYCGLIGHGQHNCKLPVVE
ncbi:hypothetical protein VPH35_004401 [Triticum aestivum]